MSKYWFPRTSALLLVLLLLVPSSTWYRCTGTYYLVPNTIRFLKSTSTIVAILPDLTAGHGDAATDHEEHPICLNYHTWGVAHVAHTAPPSTSFSHLVFLSIYPPQAAAQFLGVLFSATKRERTRFSPSLSPSVCASVPASLDRYVPSPKRLQCLWWSPHRARRCCC